MLDTIGVLTKIDREALGRYIRTWTRWDQAERFIAENGLVYPKHDPAGKVIGFTAFPQIAIADTAAAILLKLETQFGLTPGSRPKLAAMSNRDEKPPHGNSKRHVYFK